MRDDDRGHIAAAFVVVTFMSFWAGFGLASLLGWLRG